MVMSFYKISTQGLCLLSDYIVSFQTNYENVFLLDLRTDTGGLASICAFLNYSGSIVARILYYISYKRYLFSLSNDVVIRGFRQQI